jgi:hypothetical protein
MISFQVGKNIAVAVLAEQHQTMRFWGITIGWFGFGLTWFSHITVAEFHADHGRSSSGEEPDDPDCPCRATKSEQECAAQGCGFCIWGMKR